MTFRLKQIERAFFICFGFARLALSLAELPWLVLKRLQGAWVNLKKQNRLS